MKLEGSKQRLQMQFGREPTLAEWAGAVGMSCQTLQSCLRSGNRSREKMIYANFRLVIHVTKQYEGKGLNIQDLLQVAKLFLLYDVFVSSEVPEGLLTFRTFGRSNLIHISCYLFYFSSIHLLHFIVNVLMLVWNFWASDIL